MIVFDLDDTLADTGQRQHILKNGDTQDDKTWVRFFKACKKDKPIQWVIDLLDMLQDCSHHQMVIITGRSSIVEEETRHWLNKHKIYPDWIEFRPGADRRHDTEVKPEMLKKVIKMLDEKVWFIVEDRNSMVKKWRELGHNVLQCRESVY